MCWGADDDAIDFGRRRRRRLDERFSAISSGVWHTCALRSRRDPSLLGTGQFMVRHHAPLDQRFIAISSGMKHTCGVMFDGAPVCWGSDEFGQISPLSPRAAYQRIPGPPNSRRLSSTRSPTLSTESWRPKMPTLSWTGSAEEAEIDRLVVCALRVDGRGDQR